MQQTPWIERTFDFSFPEGLFPVLVERLRGTLPRIVDMITGIEDVQLSQMPDGKWSVKQHMGHLADLDELHRLRVLQYRNKETTLKAADMSNRKTEQADYNRMPVTQILTLFGEERQKLLDDLESADAAFASQTAMHPRLQKPMRLVDMVFFTAEHDDHHLAVMRHVISQLSRD